MNELFSIDIEIFIKFGITALLGLVIGLERELKRKPLGLKTCLVISIVSCMLTIISIETAYLSQGSQLGVRITMDPLRLAAQIVSGVGFLGAGVILKRENDNITGLTTAAIIWGAAGLGIAVGAGFYLESIFATILIMVCIELIPKILKYIGPKKLREKDLTLELYVSEEGNIEQVLKDIKQKKFSINNIQINDLSSGERQIMINLGVNFKKSLTSVYDYVTSIKGVRKVNIDSFN